MRFIIPMAGMSRRFRDAGYAAPKYLIEAKGQTLLERSLRSLPLELADLVIFIVLQEHLDGFDAADRIERIMGERPYRIVALPKATRGQAETVLAAADWIDPDRDLVIFNIDTTFLSERLRTALLDPAAKCDGILGSFQASGPNWSYARLDADGYVAETAEKVEISHHALTGLYHFTRGDDFVRVARKAVQQDQRSGGEFYVAPLYNDLIAEGRKFVLDPAQSFLPLGTPEELEAFLRA